MSTDIRSFKDLDVWKVSMELAVLCYRLSKQLPASERYELSSQIRRASASVPANVAEGQAAGRTGRFLNHTNIALGSLGELETCLILTTRLELLTPDQIRETLEHVERAGQLLHGLARSLRRRRLVRAAKSLPLLAVLAFGYHFLSIPGEVLLRILVNDVLSLSLTTLNLVLAGIDVDVLAHLTSCDGL
jgi:four helix bundle protein